MALVVAGCSSNTPVTDASTDASEDAGVPRPWESLIDPSRWDNAPLDDDPLAKHQPNEVDCSLAGWFLERGRLEVDTGRCNYLWLSQVTHSELRAGDRVRMRVTHFDLSSAAPAMAHLALLFDDDTVLEQRVAIPHAADVLELRWTATRAFEVGTRIGLHLHNHGQNTWLVDAIEAQRR